MDLLTELNALTVEHQDFWIAIEILAKKEDLDKDDIAGLTELYDCQ